MPKAQETCLEINLDALGNNYRYLRSKLDTESKFLGVVKAFAYGNDAIKIAQELQELGADYLAVAYTQEGVVLRDAGIHIPIMVLHPQPSHLEEIIDRCLEPSIYSLSLLKQFVSIAQLKKQKDYPIHLKFNTGLNRLGFSYSEVEPAVNLLQETSAIKVLSIFSFLSVDFFSVLY